MTHRKLLLIIAWCLPAVAGAAEFHVAPAAERYPGAALPATQRFLEENADALAICGLKLEPRADLSRAGTHTVRYQQTRDGLPVFGTSVVVRIDGTGRVLSTSVQVARDLTVPTAPALDAHAAQQRVAEAIGRPVDARVPAELGILPYRDLGGLLVWRVDVASGANPRRFVVDAQSGEVLQSYSLRHDLDDAGADDAAGPVDGGSANPLGRVYAINILKSNGVPVDLPLRALTPPATGLQTLTGFDGAVSVYNYVSGDVEGQNPDATVVMQSLNPSDVNGDFLYDPPSDPLSLTDGFAQVNVYYHLGRIRQFFTDTLGVDMSGSKWSILAVANYGPPPGTYDNAFYTPVTAPLPAWAHGRANAIFIGQGSQVDFAYDSDVFLHEFTHYVNANAIAFDDGDLTFDDLGEVVMPGAIDEGSADYFSCTVNDDAVVGEASLGDYARYLDPDLDPQHIDPGKCPDDVMGEAHEDGRLVGVSSWSIRKALGRVLADALIWEAMKALPHSPALGDFGQNVLAALDDPALGLDDAQKQAVRDVISHFGLDDCARILDLGPQKPRTVELTGMATLASMMGGGSCAMFRSYGLNIPSIFHFKHTPQASDDRVRFSVSLSTIADASDQDSSLDWSLYVRAGNPVTFQPYAGGYNPPALSKYDYALEHIKTAQADFEINDNMFPNLPFDPTKAYYLLITQQNCPSAHATVTISATSPSIDGGAPSDAAVDAAGVTGSGGSCRIAPAHAASSGAWMLLGLAGIAFVVRRRSRR